MTTPPRTRKESMKKEKQGCQNKKTKAKRSQSSIFQHFSAAADASRVDVRGLFFSFPFFDWFWFSFYISLFRRAMDTMGSSSGIRSGVYRKINIKWKCRPNRRACLTAWCPASRENNTLSGNLKWILAANLLKSETRSTTSSKPTRILMLIKGIDECILQAYFFLYLRAVWHTRFD